MLPIVCVVAVLVVLAVTRRGRPPAEGSLSAVPSGSFVSETHFLVQRLGEEAFTLMIEPEAWDYEFAPGERVLVVVKARRALQHIGINSWRDGTLTITRPRDAEVWVTLIDGSHFQVAGFASNPAPWFDSASDVTGPAPWSWPPAPQKPDA